jgi:hypothetical protein
MMQELGMSLLPAEQALGKEDDGESSNTGSDVPDLLSESSNGISPVGATLEPAHTLTPRQQFARAPWREQSTHALVPEITFNIDHTGMIFSPSTASRSDPLPADEEAADKRRFTLGPDIRTLSGHWTPIIPTITWHHAPPTATDVAQPVDMSIAQSLCALLRRSFGGSLSEL